MNKRERKFLDQAVSELVNDNYHNGMRFLFILQGRKEHANILSELSKLKTVPITEIAQRSTKFKADGKWKRFSND